MKTKKDNSPKSLALLGGKATLKKYGKEHYKKMVEKRWKKYRKEKKNAGK